jgi:HK97 family phage prohead protease
MTSVQLQKPGATNGNSAERQRQPGRAGAELAAPLPLSALSANEGANSSMSTDNESRFRPPRDGLVRAIMAIPPATEDADAVEESALELRSSTDDRATLYGYFTPFNQWTEINSVYEGHFIERTVKGAFTKTFQERTPKVLFQHGMDPQVGDKPLGAPNVLEEKSRGAYYEVPMLDTSYNRDLEPGLREGLYGASYRFRVIREDINEEPGRSDRNPDGLPERTIREAQVMEFGPVTFPAYEGASAGVRSLTDEFIAARFACDSERLQKLLTFIERLDRSPDETPGGGHRDTRYQHDAGARLHLAPRDQQVADATRIPDREEMAMTIEELRRGKRRSAGACRRSTASTPGATSPPSRSTGRSSSV